MTPDVFAYNEYREEEIYAEMLRVERDPSFRLILDNLVRQEGIHYQFWKAYSQKKTFKINRLEILLFKLMRKIFGLTFTLKFIEGSEKEAIRQYNEYLKTVNDPEMKKRVQEIIEHEKDHERKIIASIKEEKVEFISNIVLGVNDGLIELTGALVGFSFAFQKPALVALTGFITGLAASLSMASSAYMQAQYEEGKSAVRAALYTGMAYVVVVCLLILPYILFSSTFIAVPMMLAIAISVISGVSYYTSVVFERKFLRQFLEMTIFSLGVAGVSFSIGSLLRYWFNIEV
jgi:VIT1/CCC1 family predicted Fe2+/Mn2+ transporter